MENTFDTIISTDKYIKVQMIFDYKSSLMMQKAYYFSSLWKKIFLNETFLPKPGQFKWIKNFSTKLKFFIHNEKDSLESSSTL